MADSPRFSWQSVTDLTFDAENRLYLVGMERQRGETVQACSLTRDGDLRWVHDESLKELPYESRDVRIVGLHNGALLLRAPHQHALIKLDAHSGEFLATSGEREPEGARLPWLDACRFESLDAGEDGSLLGVCNRRLLRWTTDGKSIRTWPRQPVLWDVLSMGLISLERRASLYLPGKNDHGFETDQACRGRKLRDPSALSMFSGGLADRPATAHAIAPGWDGKIYLVDESKGYVLLARYDSTGDFEYRVALRPDFGSFREMLGADGDGRIHLMFTGDDNEHRLIRVSSNGEEATALLEGDDLRHQTTAIARDGSIALASTYGRLQIIGESGETIFEQEGKGDPPEIKKPAVKKHGMTASLSKARPMRFLLIGVLFLLGLGRIADLQLNVKPTVQNVVASGEAIRLGSSRFEFQLTPGTAQKILNILPGEIVREAIVLAFLLWAGLLLWKYPRNIFVFPAIALILPNVLAAAWHALDFQPFYFLHLRFNWSFLLYLASFFLIYVWGSYIVGLPKKNRISWPGHG